MPGVLPLLLFSFALFLAAVGAEEKTLPSVFDAPVPAYDIASLVNDVNVSRSMAVTRTKGGLFDCDCRALIDDINVTRAIAVTEIKFRLQDEESWYQVGMEYVDSFHAGVTQTVHVFSANADRQLAIWTGDKNLPKPVDRTPPREGNASEGMSDYFSWLFHDDTYLYSTEASYMILRVGFETNKEAGPKFLNDIKLAISLPHTQNHLQLYIGDPLADQDKNVVDNQGNVDSTTTVGARYYIPELIHKLKTDVSAGFRGIANPFTQVRFGYPVNFYDWRIRPVQYVDYSVKRRFYEETDLYFDRRISRREMVRLQLQRSTQTQKAGMAYNASLSYFNTLRFGTGFRTFVSMSGETVLDEGRYADPHYDDVDPHVGIYLYSIGARWKESFLRDWLFYEIDSRIDYDMLYNWRPNYVNQFWIEFYFGDV